MKKIAELRAHLLSCNGYLAENPERLITFVEEGSIQFARGENYSHGYRYVAQIVVTDFSDEIDAIMIPLLQWMSRYNPNNDASQFLTFEAEILSNDMVDLMLRVPMEERVVTKIDCATGRIEAEHRMPEFGDDECPAQRWTLYARDELADESYRQIAGWETR